MERGVKRHHKTMNTRKLVPVLCAGFFVSATVSFAAERTIPTPVPSGFVDTESSVNVPLSDWPDLGRRVTIDLTAYATPSNAVQIAFGQDTNGDEDLEPEETWFVIGVECGEPFLRYEGQRSEVKGQTVEFIPPSSGSASNLCLAVFSLKQPQPSSSRFSFAKVTTRGREDSAAQIVAEIQKPGHVLFLR